MRRLAVVALVGLVMCSVAACAPHIRDSHAASSTPSGVSPTTAVPQHHTSLRARLGADSVPWAGAVTTGTVVVDRVPGAAAISPPEWTARLTRALTEAEGAIARATGRPSPFLVAYLPPDEPSFQRAVAGTSDDGAPQGDVAGVTAPVTSAPDGSSIIVLNPSVMPTLNRRAARVVVIHEATHVATDAVHASGPLWLQEGFADYVAIGAVGVPARTAAAEAIGWLQHHPVPARWPSDAAFTGPARRVRVAYELAWLGVRQLADDVGRQRLWTFYRQAEGGIPLSSAATTVLGTQPRALARSWRGTLAGLARGR